MKNKVSKWISSVTAAVLLMAAAGVAATAASNAFTPEQAQAIAAKQIPQGSIHLKTQMDNNKYEIEYYNEGKKERYDIDISLHTQKITAYETKLVMGSGSATTTLNEQGAKDVVLKEFPKAEISSTTLETDDRLKQYKVYFKTDTLYGSMEINPETGAILERDLVIGATAPASSGSSSAVSATPGDSLITLEAAQSIAKAKAPDAKLVDCRLDYDDGYPRYEGKLRNGNWEYEFEIDAKNGNIIEWEADYDD